MIDWKDLIGGVVFEFREPGSELSFATPIIQ